MTILLKNNLLFVHIPKTGGSWVEAVIHKTKLFEQLFDKHDTVKRVNLPNANSFCFIRNPLTWYQSRWCGPQHHERLTEYKRKNYKVKVTDDIDNKEEYAYFHVWLNKILNTNDPLFFRTENNTKNVQTILKFENGLANSLIKILHEHNLIFDKQLILDTPPQNKSVPSHLPFRGYPDLNLIDKVIQTHKILFEKYDYSTNVDDYKNLVDPID